MNVKNISLINKGTVNKNRVDIEVKGGYIELYFSYQTIVGFSYNINGRQEYCVRQNDWSTTTGKFLNELELDHKRRLPSAEFEGKLANLFNDN
jgi:hypothetical protein